MLGLEQSLGSRIVTYADDLVILCKKGKAEEALQRLREMVADTLRMRTETYNEVARYVHEQIAQGITKIALINLRASATKEQSMNVCDKMIEAFNALMRRQPEEYRLDHVAHLTHEQLGKRLHKFIVLTHRGALTPDRGVWDTIMAW